jgi:hypothetical protein
LDIRLLRLPALIAHSLVAKIKNLHTGLSDMNLSRIFFIAIVCVSSTASAYAQAFPEDSISKKFDTYRKQAFQEKVYVRTDRNIYVTGELMWFKVYCVDGYSNRPQDLSKVVYLEMLNEINEPVLQRKVEMIDGIGVGSMFVPAALSAGNYKIRAYTNWMKNFGPDYFFHSTISVVNAFVKTAAPTAKANVTYDAQFFPEGGDLVVGLRSKVAFRVLDQSGKGIAFRGAIVNEKNDTVAHFSPLKFGIGSFYLTPTSTSKYKAIIKDERGARSTYNLREAKENGYVMNVTDAGDAINVDITASAQQDNFAPVYLFVQCRLGIIAKDSRSIQQGKTSFKVNKSDLPAGITHFTLFDRDLKPVAERLYFERQEQTMTVSAKTEVISHGNRSRVKLKVTSNTNANLSVSVFKNDSLPSAVNANLFDYLWLSSDLKGSVESPEYYLSSNDTTSARAADNLMLTHGWRRFTWNDVLKKPVAFNYLPEVRGHIIRGTVKQFNGEPAPGVLAYMGSPQSYVRVYGSRADRKGEIQFEVKDFYGSKKIYVATNLRVDSTHIIRLTNPFSEDYSPWPLPPLSLPPTVGKQLLDRSVAMQVQDIYYRDQVNSFIPPNVDSLQFYGPADEIYNLDEYTRFPILEEVLREYVPGVMVRKKKDGYHFMVIDRVNKALFREDPMILIDGVPVFNIDKVIAFDPLRIKRLEVIAREYYDGILSFPGLMSLYTYANDLGGFPIDSRVLTTDYDGLQVQREFYAPKYDNGNSKESRLPDPRTLLYWNPTLTTTSDKASEIEFFTSDVPGNYTIVVEGISKDGKAATASGSFVVTKVNN